MAQNLVLLKRQPLANVWQENCCHEQAQARGLNYRRSDAASSNAVTEGISKLLQEHGLFQFIDGNMPVRLARPSNVHHGNIRGLQSIRTPDIPL